MIRILILITSCLLITNCGEHHETNSPTSGPELIHHQIILENNTDLPGSAGDWEFTLDANATAAALAAKINAYTQQIGEGSPQQVFQAVPQQFSWL